MHAPASRGSFHPTFFRSLTFLQLHYLQMPVFSFFSFFFFFEDLPPFEVTGACKTRHVAPHLSLSLSLSLSPLNRLITRFESAVHVSFLLLFSFSSATDV